MNKSTWVKIGAALVGLGAAAALTWMVVRPSVPALNDFDRYVFVPSRGAPEVTVIDSRADKVVARIALKAAPGQVVVSPAVGKLIASDPRTQTLSIVNLETREIESVIPLDIKPDYMQMSPDGYLLAVGDVSAGAVSVVSLQQGRPLARVDGLAEPYNLRFNVDGSTIYVANRSADRVSVIDIVQGKVIEEIAVASPAPGSATIASDAKGVQGITNMTGTPNGRFGFATFKDRDQLAVLDLQERKTIKSLLLGKRPWRAYATADGRYMLVPNNGDKTVTVIATGSLDVVATLPGAAEMTAVNTGWFDSVAFVISRGENKAVVLDLMKLAHAGEIPLPRAPGAGVVTPDGKKLYVELSGSNQVAVIDTRARTLIATIDDVGTEPSGATMGHANNYCH